MIDGDIIECPICYEQTSADQFIELTCCIDKQICRFCLDCLTIPICPYCRRRLPHVEGRRMAASYTEVPSFLYNRQAEFMADIGLVDDIDCRLLDSRILRRRIRRLRKLQMRTNH